MNPVLEETAYVMQNAKFVSINKDRIPLLPIYDKSIPVWDNEIPHKDSKSLLSYIFVLDTLNFCFWNNNGKKWSVEYQNKTYSGYRGLEAVLKKAVYSNTPITDMNYLADLTMPDLEKILCGNGQLLLMEERLKALNELGTVIVQDYGGQAGYLLEEAGFDALNLAFLVARKLSSFRDVALYKGQKIPFLKRAQILAGDIYGAFGGKDYGNLVNMDQLSVFADYKLPQLLHAHGVMVYTAELEQKIMNKELIPAFSEEEIEIRAATIQSVFEIQKIFLEHNRNLCHFQIDWILWNTSKSIDLKVPHHCTKTIFY